MPWQSPGNYTPSDRLHSDDLNKLHQDDVTWGGDVNGGGYTLSNVVLEGVTGLASGPAVTSVFTRIGDVVALAADYAAFYVPLGTTDHRRRRHVRRRRTERPTSRSRRW